MASPDWNEESEEGSEWMDDGYERGFEADSDMDADEDADDDLLDDEFVEFGGEDADESDELEAVIDEGEALIEEGDYQAALELFREASERFAESPTVLYHLGQTALVLFSDQTDDLTSWEDDDELSGYYEDAQNAFEAALSLDEDFYPALNGQGALLMVTGSVEGAIECWERSLEIDPDQEEIVSALEEAREQLD